MFFIVNRKRFRDALKLTRDDRSKASSRQHGPYYRIEARQEPAEPAGKGGRLRLTGQKGEAVIPATVYETGVLFIKLTLFREIVDFLKGQRTLAVQVNGEGLHINAVSMPLESNGMLLYVDPDRAPEKHPEETTPPAQANAPGEQEPPMEGGLFG